MCFVFIFRHLLLDTFLIEYRLLNIEYLLYRFAMSFSYQAAPQFQTSSFEIHLLLITFHVSLFTFNSAIE